MPCPYYKNGYCTSPKLPQPSTHVVTLERCMGDESVYRVCRYYVERDEEKRSKTILSYNKRNELPMGLRVYPAIHILYTEIKSDCPYYKLYEVSGGYVAYCDKLKRLLTRSEAHRCSKYHEQCPYKQML